MFPLVKTRENKERKFERGYMDNLIGWLNEPG